MNKDIKLMAAGKGIRMWEIAKELGVAAETFCRWLRYDLDNEKKTLIITAIEKLSQGAK